MTFLADDQIQVLDWPQGHAFEEGDQVMWFFPDRVFLYRVLSVIPELDNDSELTCVTLYKVY